MRRLVFLTLSAFATMAGAAPISWVLNTNTTIDTVNIATNASLPFGTTPFVSQSLARTLAGRLISADSAGNLWDVTAAPIPVGPTGMTQIGDLDLGAGGLWGYSNATQQLFFYDLGLSTTTYAQVIAIPTGATVTGVAYQPTTGDVYLSAYTSLNNDRLLRVTPFATSATMVGAMANGDAFSYFADIDFDPSGTLYAMSFYHRWFYTVSTTTAGTTFVSAGPHKDTTAMALDPVPEPATLLVLGLGSVALARRRKARP